jgi:polysaccharide biosynthesis/export protein
LNTSSMRMRRNGWGNGTVILIVCSVLFGCVVLDNSPAVAEYVVGPDDVLALTVWEHPELSRTLTVRADGTITVPPIGDLPAAGRVTAALARDIEARFYSVLRLTTQATVSVVAFNSQKVYLAGQVSTPGRFSFEVIPNLIDFLGMTGGLGATSDLAHVRLLRSGTQGSQTVNVDLTRAVQSGDMTGVPPLQSGDIVYVPGIAGAGPSLGNDTVYVLGEVVRPGPYGMSPGLDLLRLLSVAGGITPMGDLEHAEVLSAPGREGRFRVRIDLNREMQSGRGGLTLKPGDTVVIPSRQAGAARQTWGVLRETLGVSRDVLNLFLIKNVLK